MICYPKSVTLLRAVTVTVTKVLLIAKWSRLDIYMVGFSYYELFLYVTGFSKLLRLVNYFYSL